MTSESCIATTKVEAMRLCLILSLCNLLVNFYAFGAEIEFAIGAIWQILTWSLSLSDNQTYIRIIPVTALS